jgi:hypothetical protein
LIRCTKCAAPLDYESFNTQAFSPCAACGTLSRVDVFPAVYKDLSTRASGESALMDDEASCFYHPNKQAAVSCSSCGRFLCSLCDVDFNGRHLCAACLESGKTKGKIQDMENHRFLYDNMALALAFFPLIIFPITILTAPLAVFFVIRYWKRPSSIIKRSKIRQLIALLICGIEITGWSFFLYAMA